MTTRAGDTVGISIVKLQKLYMRVLAVILMLMSAIGLVAQIAVITRRGESIMFFGVLPIFILVVLGGIVLVLIERNNLRTSARILIYSTVIAAAITVFLSAQNPNNDRQALLAGSYLVIGTIAIITSAVLGTRIEYYLGLFVTTASGVIVAISVIDKLATPAEQANLVSSTAVIIFTQILIGLSLRFFVGAMQKTADSTQNLNELLEASSYVGQIIARYLSADELYQRTVDIIRDRFGYYHVQIYTLDEDAVQAELKATTDSGNARPTRQLLPIGPQSLISRVARIHDAVVIDNVDNSERAYSELLPTTQSAILVPLLDNDRVIGVLDVQSMRPNVFKQAEQQALKLLASQLATAIRNADLFEQQQHSVLENQRLLEESEHSLGEISRLNSSLTREAWNQYMFGRHHLSGISLEGNKFTTNAQWTEAMIESVKGQQPVVKRKDINRVVATPLILRGEVIGALEIETSTTNDDIELELVDIVEGVAQRLAVSLDNARLFEEIQETSYNEQIISGLVTEFQAADSLEALLKAALEGLSSSLGATSGAIRMKQASLNTNYAMLQPSQPAKVMNGHNGNGSNGHHQNGTMNGQHDMAPKTPPATDDNTGGIA
ncbi:MAG: GAF domain-containing protein [Anaerolineae bacterium]|nr:GAF domain-containing protein [Anaerolineae bacterium]